MGPAPRGRHPVLVNNSRGATEPRPRPPPCPCHAEVDVPTRIAPGTLEKVALLVARAERGLPLFVAGDRAGLPVGVSWDSTRRRWRARVWSGGRHRHL